MISISEAEAEVMAVLWRADQQSAEDIAVAMAERQDWQLATIKTLLNRLLNKGAISAKKDGRRYLYSALLRRSEWQRRQSTNLIDRVFDGNVAPLVAHFSKHRKLAPADVEALKKLIDAYENGNGGSNV